MKVKFGKTSLNAYPAMGGAQWKATFEDNRKVPEGSPAKENYKMSKFSTLLVIGLVFTLLAWIPQKTNAHDVVKVVVYNGSSFKINRLNLFIDTTLVDSSRKNFSAGKTDEVLWEASDKKNDGELSFDYAIFASSQFEKCSIKIKTTAGSPAGQLKKVQLADGRNYNLDNTVDEAITVRYKVTGTEESSRCNLDGVRKRRR